MSKKSKVPDLNEPFRHQDHPRPRTRREFVAQGFMTGAATVIAPTLAGMLAYPRAARAALAPDIQTAVTNCNITTGAGKIPFICFDLAGGGNIAGSNVLVGGPKGQMDFLTVAGYSKLGLPGSMVPNASATGADAITYLLSDGTATVTSTVTIVSDAFRFTQPVHGLQVIRRAGTVYAMDAGAEICTPHDDCVLIMPTRKPKRGETAVRLGRFVS